MLVQDMDWKKDFQEMSKAIKGFVQAQRKTNEKMKKLDDKYENNEGKYKENEEYENQDRRGN